MDTDTIKSGNQKSASAVVDEQVVSWKIEEPSRIKDRIESVGVNQYRGKRLLDVSLGIIGAAVYFLIFPFIAAGIKLTSPGPVLFKQRRTGYKGEVFTCYKFRTMHILDKKAHSDEPNITRIGDKRIFSFGNILRKTNLDELPQIMNVLKGEMSLVGPRPYMVDECKYWDEKFDDHFYRYAVHPGITGQAQVKGYRGGTFDEGSMRIRLDYDLIYTEKNSLLLDLKIIFRTVMQMIASKTKAH